MGSFTSTSYCNNAELGLDQACLSVTSHLTTNLTLWARSSECDKCDPSVIHAVPPSANFSLSILTQFPWVFSVLNQFDNSIICNETFQQLFEHGNYVWNVSENGCSNVDLVNSPGYQYQPIITITATLLLISLLWDLVKCAYNSEWLNQRWPRNIPFSELQSDLGSPSATNDDEPSMVRVELQPIRRSNSRVNSLDTFRGLSISLMIFVNYGGGKYWFFNHSPWNGLTVADLVFPWFLWIMGSSTAIALRTQLRSCVTRRRIFLRVLRRSLALFALGLVLSSFRLESTRLSELRILGVLQRIGLTYLIVGSIETVLMKPQGTFQYGRWLVIQDLLDSWLQWLIVLALTAAHVLLTLLLLVPGCPTGYLGPGGRHDHGRWENCTGGAAGYIDRTVFGEHHIYQSPSCRHVYQTKMAYDPEGLLGTLSAVLLVYLGVHSGRILTSFNYTNQRVFRWLGWSLVTGLIAGVLCNWSKNDGLIPVNKNLMSLSFVLALASMSFFIQTVLYIIIDDRHWLNGTPLRYAGMNSIVLYVGHMLTHHLFPWSWQPVTNSHLEYMAMNTWAVLLWLFIAYVLYKKKIFLAL